MEVRLAKQPQCQPLRLEAAIAAAADRGGNLDPSQNIRDPVVLDPVQPAVAGEQQLVAETAGELELVLSIPAMGEGKSGRSRCLAQLLLKILPGMPQLGLGIVKSREWFMADTVGSNRHARTRKVLETQIIQHFGRIAGLGRRQVPQDFLPLRDRELGNGGNDPTDRRQRIMFWLGLIGP
jgi:hypothetical protein